MRGPRGNQVRKEKGPRINEYIRVPEIRLIGDDAKQYGVVTIEQARLIAGDLGLDLVEVSPNAKPPVVKLIDYGKFKYQQQKKAAIAKKKQVQVQIKEIQFRPNIDKHDLDTKLKKAERFLGDGDKLKLVMQFRGREMAYQDAGLSKFKEIIENICEYGGLIESDPKPMGRRVIAMIAPTKKKMSAKEKEDLAKATQKDKV